MTTLARPRTSHGLNDEIARLEQAVRTNPDDYASSERRNLLRLRHPESVPPGMPRVLIGLCDAGTVWQATVRPWAVTVAFGYGDPAHSTLDFLWASRDQTDVRSLLDRLPAGFAPDVLLLMLPEFANVPRGIAESPLPVVLWVQDYLLGLPKLIALAPSVAGVASIDRLALPVLRRLGLDAFHGPGNGYEYGAFEADVDAPRELDVAYLIGYDRTHVNPTYLERDRIVVELAQLQREATLLIGRDLDGAGVMHGPNYLRALRSSKIVVCFTIADKLHPAICEALAAGALVMVNRGMGVAASALTDGRDAVFYDRHDLAGTIRRYLRDDAKRIEIARAGQALIAGLGTHARMAGDTIDAIVQRRERLAAPRARQAIGGDLRDGVVAAFDGRLEAAQAYFELSRQLDGGDGQVASNNLAVVEMLLASAAGDGAARHFERAALLLAQAVTGSLPRPVPRFNRAVLASQSGDPLPAGHLDDLDELATGTVAADASPLELIIPPETLDVAGFFWRKARLWVEWAQLIERYPDGGLELATGFASLAAARAWGLQSDALRARGDAPGARHAARRALDLTPCDPNPALRYGELALEADDWEAAIPALKAAVEYRPLGMRARLLYGAALGAAGRVAELERLTRES